MLFCSILHAAVTSDLYDDRLIRQAKNAKIAFRQNRIEDARHIINDPYYNVDYDYDTETGRYLDVEMMIQGKCGSKLA